MTAPTRADQRAAIRRTLAWALVVGLCIAALTSISAILSGDFDENDGRVIAASVGFGIFTAVGASGASLRLRDGSRLRDLGLVTMGLAGCSFLLLIVALWNWDAGGPWQWFGCFALAALAASHASLVSGAWRDTDSEAVKLLSRTSIGLATFDSLIGILAISGLLDDAGGGAGELVAVLVILLLLTTVLPPILRRLQEGPSEAPPTLATELLAAADRIEAMNGDPAIRRECEQLRRLARSQAG